MSSLTSANQLDFLQPISKTVLRGESQIVDNREISRIKFANVSAKINDRCLASEHTRQMLQTTRDIDHLFEESQPFFAKHVSHVQSTKEYPSKSKYAGHWSQNGWEGEGEYTYPHGVKFVGEFRDSQLNGHGVLEYPMGQRLKGMWRRDKLISWTYTFNDGGEYIEPWKYCAFPDRRYNTSINRGLRPPGEERITAETPPRVIPDGCYDVGEGFYNPKIRSIISANDLNKILRIPNRDEETWIIKNCRKSWESPIGYQPELYEFWNNGTKQATTEILESMSFEGESKTSDNPVEEEALLQN